MSSAVNRRKTILEQAKLLDRSTSSARFQIEKVLDDDDETNCRRSIGRIPSAPLFSK